MIGVNITSNTKHIVAGTYSSPSININSSYICGNNKNDTKNLIGVLRWNADKKTLEIFDGSYWVSIYSKLELHISSELQDIIDWALAKMKEEKEYEKLAMEYPIIHSIYENLKKEKEKLRFVTALVKDNNDQSS
jgi:hypothetical protein